MEEEGGGENGKRRIKLFCPSLSKLVQIIAGDDQKLDLGSISRAFGLDPNTLKLNGYFISRGADLIASSLTWRSLIGFFSARGFPTGAAHSDALIVHGKLCKIGSKRSHYVEDGGNGIVNDNEGSYCRENKRAQREIVFDESNGSCSKRKWWVVEDESHLKKRRSSEEAAVSGPFSCSVNGRNLKRLRGDEVVGGPWKKIR